MTGWIIALVVVALAALGGCIACTSVNREHAEAANLPLRQKAFGQLHDGTYTGEYAGGMYKWRVIAAQSVDVDVISGATLTSKAYLKAVEDAVSRAETK